MISQTQSLLSIDGSLGEGGGQVLRTSLALALITGRPFTVTNIRSRRPKPGLMAQHLKAVEAAREIGKARVEGAVLGSQSLVFEPAGLTCGDFHFDIRTAGSTSLVLQTILPPLSFASARSTIALIGGTHVPWSPCFHFLEMHWLHYMQGSALTFICSWMLLASTPEVAACWLRCNRSHDFRHCVLIIAER